MRYLLDSRGPRGDPANMRVVRVVLVAVLLGTGACASVQPLVEPAQFIAQANPPVVYVTFKNHSKVSLTRPRVSGDSLHGWVTGMASPVGAPLSHIERVEVRRRDRKRTTLMIVGLTTLTAGTALYALLQGGGNTVSGLSCDATYYR